MKPHGSQLVVLIGSVLLIAVAMNAQCRPIHYRDGNVLADSKAETLLQISISPNDLAPEKLRCLAKELKNRFPESEEITAMIFTSHDAALNWRPTGLESSPQDWVRQSYLHAIYNSTKGQEYVELFPLYALTDIETKFDPDSKGPIACPAQVAHRCLVSLQELGYPADAFRTGKSGAVTLTGTIAKNGTVANIRIDSPRGEDTIFSKSAVQNLKTWRFDQAQRNVPIRIKFSYVFDKDETDNKPTRLKFKLPDEIIVTASPMH